MGLTTGQRKAAHDQDFCFRILKSFGSLWLTFQHVAINFTRILAALLNYPGDPAGA
jgi:succinate-acetate transporter protein